MLLLMLGHWWMFLADDGFGPCSCKEGKKVLYGTNTIHISAPALHHSIQDIIPQPQLDLITSLELAWNPDYLRLEKGFTDLDDDEDDHDDENTKHNPPNTTIRTTPIFPSLKLLRLTFHYLTMGEIDHATNLEWLYLSKTLLATASQPTPSPLSTTSSRGPSHTRPK